MIKYRISTILITFCLISALCGCGQASGEIDNSEFIKYDIALVMPKVEYKICDTSELVTVYFPVVTSKEITGTELGGVAAKLPLAKGDMKVVLRPMLQDKINFSYQDKYISFLKYRVNIENNELLTVNDAVTLCDTMLWIYHNSEFQQIQVDGDYLQVMIVENNEDIVSPNWENIIAKMNTDIEVQLENKATD